MISKADPIKYILSRLILSGQLVKWVAILKQYDLVYLPRKAVKGQALTKFLADDPISDAWELNNDLIKVCSSLISSHLRKHTLTEPRDMMVLVQD